ncbi:antibiotic biosynthesis monooxygenase family protein [Amycolatopsis sp. A133]|uniref:antibiotic biosynthesis monooxygenase family protein n=1 Tax=Amycolatopsis sp. A133 TaxID=3064472 RepID=UPI0027FBA99E|nr:antibiotic biosynthesis monooxygenase family protein [Amycolatopsis sp. A133]MDQ7803505.1 antibiotic biosynthesis monooxygenase family protein [Amycolatopsis sp. A133]
MTTARVRVLVYVAAPGGGADAVTDAYHDISRALAGTPGLLGNELLRSVRDPAAFAVMSEWEDLAAFQEWENGPGHRPATAPLREYGTGFQVYQVTAAY